MPWTSHWEGQGLRTTASTQKRVLLSRLKSCCGEKVMWGSARPGVVGWEGSPLPLSLRGPCSARLARPGKFPVLSPRHPAQPDPHPAF